MTAGKGGANRLCERRFFGRDRRRKSSSPPAFFSTTMTFSGALLNQMQLNNRPLLGDRGRSTYYQVICRSLSRTCAVGTSFEIIENLRCRPSNGTRGGSG